jgi:hypothetical protein
VRREIPSPLELQMARIARANAILAVVFALALAWVVLR